MKIGVMLRKDGNRYTFNTEIEEVIAFYGGTVLLMTRYDENLLKLVDGLLLQGGEDYTEDDFKVLSYCYEKNMPILGICLGMQTMGVFLEGKLGILENDFHYQVGKENVHAIKIDTNSKLYDIIKQDRVSVNSRHHEFLLKTKAFVSAVSEDDIIEAIEDPSKTFFIGVQWHPETKFRENATSLLLFQAFFDTVSSSSFYCTNFQN